jgi:hypothetical protein
MEDGAKFDPHVSDAQQEALRNVLRKYQKRESPIQTFFENAITGIIDVYINTRNRIIQSIGEDTYNKLADAVEKVIMNFPLP